MTTPISNTTTPAQSTAPDVLDRIEAKIKARLPQDAASPPPASPQSQSGGLSTTDVPTMPPPPPMDADQMSLLVSQMQIKTQDQSFAISQQGLEQMNAKRKAMDSKVYQAIQKMDHYYEEAKKDKTMAQMGLNKAHSKGWHILGSIVQDLSPEGIGAQIAEAAANKKAGKAESAMTGDQAKSEKIGKQMKKMEGTLKNIASALNQTASITSQMQDSAGTAQDKILRGLQNQV